MHWHSWSARFDSYDNSNLDLTAFVDVLFNLLFFFMLTAGMAQHMLLDVQLPEVQGKQAQTQSQDPVVALTQKGAVLWQGEQLPLDVLVQRLQALAPAQRERIWLQADGRATHANVARVMGKLQQLTKQIFLVTTGQ
ncbi:MAG: biopolymer transporter ExbD [Myxococcota bacterium]